MDGNPNEKCLRQKGSTYRRKMQERRYHVCIRASLPSGSHDHRIVETWAEPHEAEEVDERTVKVKADLISEFVGVGPSLSTPCG